MRSILKKTINLKPKQYLIVILAIISVVTFARCLFLQDKVDKYRELEGYEVGFEDYYYCTPMDIIILESQLWIKETVCEDVKY